MLAVEFIRTNPDVVRQSLSRRGSSESIKLIDEILKQDQILRETLTLQQTKQQAINQENRSIAALMREGDKEAAKDLIERQKNLKVEIKKLSQNVAHSEQVLSELLLAIPNVTHESVPDGLTETDNVIVHDHGELPSFDFPALPHWELSKQHQLIDFERGAKVAGAGFPFYMGAGAKLHRALINFFINSATLEYTEVRPPLFVNAASAQGTGQLPDKEGQMYYTEDGFYPVPRLRSR